RGGGPQLTLSRFAHEAVASNGAIPAAAQQATHNIRLRSDRYARTRSRSDPFDNPGQVLRQTAHVSTHLGDYGGCKIDRDYVGTTLRQTYLRHADDEDDGGDTSERD